MTGADSVSVVSQEQSLNLGEKTAADLIDADVSISWDGTAGSVHGNLKYVTDWTEFNPGNEDEQNGNFFPVKLDDQYAGQNITVSRNGGKEKTAVDLMWILRVPNGNTIFTFKAEGREIFTLNFATATLAGAGVG